jgi:hypothetical protein
MTNRLEYSDRIYRFLHGMKPDNPVEIEMLPFDILPSPKAKDYFIEIVKDFIDNDNGRQAGFYIEFNNAFLKIRKLKYFGGSKPHTK